MHSRLRIESGDSDEGRTPSKSTPRSRTDSEFELLPRSMRQPQLAPAREVHLGSWNHPGGSWIHRARKRAAAAHHRALQYYCLWTIFVYFGCMMVVVLAVLIAFVEKWSVLEAIYFLMLTGKEAGGRRSRAGVGCCLAHSCSSTFPCAFIASVT